MKRNPVSTVYLLGALALLMGALPGAHAGESPLAITAPSNLVNVGETLQLQVTLNNGTPTDVTASPQTYYQSSNEFSATVSQDGLVTGEEIGQAMITVFHGDLGVAIESMVTNTFQVIVGVPGDRDGDGLSDDYETQNGLDPDDPDDVNGDPDNDGLLNLEEFEEGTDPQNPDTDGDGSLDGDEAAGDSDPLTPDDFQFDETWQFMVNGQQVQAEPGGVFRISNIAAPDEFGSGGPGTAPDFLSDNFLRVVGSSTANGRTRWAFSEPFQIEQGEVFVVPELTLTFDPPPFPESIRIALSEVLLTAGETSQATVTGVLADGSERDLTAREAWTIYRTSNPDVAMVGPDGEVTGAGAGSAFITAVNESATAVTRIEVVDSTASFTIQGFVQLPDGTPVEGATVSTFFGDTTTTDAEGFYSFDVTIPGDQTTVSIRVDFQQGEDRFVGSTVAQAEPDGISDAGIISLEAGTSAGREFIVLFQPNFNNANNSLTLFISAESQTTGEVQIPGLGFISPFNVTPGTVTEVEIPGDAVVTVNDDIENKGIVVTALDDINVYGLNEVAFTTDAFVGLPVETFGTSFLPLGWPDGRNGASQFAVVASQDNTTVTITPSVDAGQRTAGEAFDITLNRNEVYQLQTNGTGDDLTGTVITADRPVGLFAGNSCANIPDDGFNFCDTVVQQIPPVPTWGQRIFTLPLQTRMDGDTFRILAAEDETAVTIAGPEEPESFMLNAGEAAQRLLEGTNEISADKPILVAQYANSSGFDNTLGDPFMIILPPFEQFLDSYTFATPGATFETNFVNIICRTEDAENEEVFLDGTAIPADMFQSVGDSGFSCTKQSIGMGSHTVTSTEPCGIYVYGFAEDNSYGYTGGMALADLKRN